MGFQAIRRWLILVVVFAYTPVIAYAENDTCTFIEGGHSYIKVTHQQSTVAYTLKTAGKDWISSPYGWHATGHLGCKTCASGTPSGGLYFLTSKAELDERESRYGITVPTNSKDRLARQKERFGYPYIPLRKGEIIPLGGSDDLQIGPLKGYAVKFQITEQKQKKLFPNDAVTPPVGVLAITLTDGCVQFSTTLLMRLNGESTEWPALTSLLNEISIERGGAEIAPPALPGDIIRIPN
ncbi:MAG: hypothetical protein JJ900_08655 [Rhodospirillales bacterium]|nr:hypothetical protein [Rhodospirillales bacterium]MBO6786908.1 hypothetical protein [Rhodospirillales bacterium]